MSSLSKSKNKQNRFELRTLLETSRLLIESRETDFILNNLLLITMGKMLVPRGAVLIFQPDSGDYLITKIKGRAVVSEGDRIPIPWKPDDYEDIALDPVTMKPDPPKLFEGKNKGLFFNLKTGTHHLGYLYLGRKGNDQVLNGPEIEFVESLCIISSVAISNSRMFSEMREMNRQLDRKVYELNTLFDLSKEFSLMVDPDRIASTFKFALLGQLLIRKFFLLYKIDGKINLLASSGLVTQPDLHQKKELFDLPEDVLLIGPDEAGSIPFLKDNGIAALIALQMQGEKTAVVGVSERANKETFSQSDFNFLQSLGNLAVLSIQKTLFLEEQIEKERLEEEVNIAKNIQTGLYPDPIPRIPSLDLAAKNIPSQQVGGDYFDIVKTPDNNYIFAIGDVTGKGFPAALLMANLQAMLHVLLPVDVSLVEATGRINNLIFKNTPSDKFITFFWCKYFQETKTLKYINAGHNPTLLLRRESETFDELGEGGLILGAMPTLSPYKESDVELHPGDIIVFYTDGVTETFNGDDTVFGEERLKATILNNRGKKAADLLETIVDEVYKFSNDGFSDDLTLIIVKAV
ncbi:MAG: SpoIIE family protein phosphatase [Balneolaceae bacterium]